YKVADFNELSGFLELLKAQDESINSQFTKFLPTLASDEVDSVLDEVNKESLSESEIALLEKEKSNREGAVAVAGRMLRTLYHRFKEAKSPTDQDLMDMAFELLSLQYYLHRDALYKERLFRRKIVQFEREGKQRKTAEEYAKTLVEYRDWSLAEGLKDQVQEFINLAKKRYKDM
ncbi:MAG TPA: hypothetical protein VK255_01170, partial [Patescibacteria group bacterium]|nr:hypothetical protein [Patescibacteria group bacterium]